MFLQGGAISDVQSSKQVINESPAHSLTLEQYFLVWALLFLVIISILHNNHLAQPLQLYR